jgi:type 1 fimbriae regulatory protein FimB
MQFLTQGEVLDVLRAAYEKSHRDHLLILMAYRHGLRASEVTGIRLSDLQGGYLTVQRKKGSLKTIQPILPHTGQPLLNEARHLTAWIKERPAHLGDALFPSEKGGALLPTSFTAIFHKYAEVAGLPPNKRHPHALKHSVVSHLLNNGMEIAFVKEYVGHASISSTMRYAHISGVDANKRAETALINAFAR